MILDPGDQIETESGFELLSKPDPGPDPQPKGTIPYGTAFNLCIFYDMIKSSSIFIYVYILVVSFLKRERKREGESTWVRETTLSLMRLD